MTQMATGLDGSWPVPTGAKCLAGSMPGVPQPTPLGVSFFLPFSHMAGMVTASRHDVEAQIHGPMSSPRFFSSLFHFFSIHLPFLLSS